MNIKSPSQTKAWMTCPIYRQLSYKEKLVPRRLSKRDIAAIGGRAWARGMEIYNTHGGLANTHAAVQFEIARAKQRIIALGREVPEWEHAYFASLEPRLKHAIDKYDASEPLKGFRIVEVEKHLPDHGNARIDLVVEDDFGYMIVDYKYKLRLDTKYYDKEVEKYRNDWQQLHYTWAYKDYAKVDITRYGIYLVVTEPKFSAILHEYPVHPETLSVWQQSATQVWEHMRKEDAGEELPFMVADHETKYGPCEYQRACFEHRWDMDRMLTNDYVVDKEEIL